MKTAALLSVLAFVWSLAALIKAVAIISRGESYTFTWWDGGLTLSGKALGRAGAIAFAAFCGAILVVSSYLLVKMGALR